MPEAYLIILTTAEITSDLPEYLRYTRTIQDSEKHKYRLPLVTASRLILIDYVSKLDDAGLQDYLDFFANVTIPTSYCEMYGPNLKIVGRPADLSPGEYETIPGLMPMYIPRLKMMEAGTWRGKEEWERVVPGGEDEYPLGQPWLWLMPLVNALYDI
ncbi:hypothetical protein FB45DRAFT_1029714 [Roridomyces roridus]|uniref:Uncharacterized protein n=1 Tax=Roridomyces roridus TaxID=1738132 RepID=A0AAD7FML8_9AGAR|nr:hypothetical protein FB45DRAFT_1029714 [Roridomyces roridus]